MIKFLCSLFKQAKKENPRPKDGLTLHIYLTNSQVVDVDRPPYKRSMTFRPGR
jgi:hypothetical protein